jgi:hypothetical protein
VALPHDSNPASVCCFVLLNSKFVDSTDARPRGNLQTALLHAASLLHQDPQLAEQQAAEILKVYPSIEAAGRIPGAANRLQGQPYKGLTLLEPLARSNFRVHLGTVASDDARPTASMYAVFADFTSRFEDQRIRLNQLTDQSRK